MKHFIDRVNTAIADHVFPLLIGYASSPIHIAALLCLWFLLLVCGSLTAFELVGGNYTNGLSAAASCAVLYQQIHTKKEVHELRAENKQLTEGLYQHVDAHVQDLHKKLDDLKPL